MTSISRASAALLLASVAACSPERKGAGGEGSAPVDSSAATKSSPDSAIAWQFTPPPSWSERTTSVIVSDGDRKQYFQNARAGQRFDYLPQDTTIAPQTLLLITVYDSTAWAAIEKEDGPPVGDVVAREGGMVYIASLPQSNPFPEKSADFAAFESRSVSLEQVKEGFRVIRR